MNDYGLPLLVLRRLSKDYEQAMLERDPSKAYQIAHDLVEMALKLQDIANENQKV
jgi:hypothetical protein